MVCDTRYPKNEFGDPRFFFYVFNLILSFSTRSQSFKKSVPGNFWARTSLNSYSEMEVVGSEHEERTPQSPKPAVAWTIVNA